ncbi:phenylalanine--tRNA ligase subunit beta [Psychrosphaera sp. B3R10]|uniref:phenylalanine--tRNA ligase subunit beta n=1 Tax=unclassified Psychrosphaera TaxID=2641570 RepID=UPI001C092D1C|nr:MULTISPECIES: phenylalanine--tRNA ligase subunit beta [unclassified Psychrosphaera]MBU2881370.1 phenylalanine--tRNA ligase subunit beta [Psychrosphaera sp. I2R16]MBU2988469.1 phenylalanine--tRNA ligase subunit beta [Psychrosphaera sp. B3R10]MDO6720031.1 phenylalanine--tRNA ligase subunit beta [Psychrosphaera sp. 1_MG-2023]
MKFSEKWLREWVNPAIGTDDLSEQLSMAGLEVDGVEDAAAEFTGVVVGEVVECGKHPEADKLQITKINVGEAGDGELIDIVCGAKNCRAGLKVAVAMVGAVLPGNFKIKKAKLRGQPSFGMLCSFSELGMADDSDGILELPTDAPIGKNVREYLNLDDKIIEIDLTPNRSDCLGIAGVAREVGVLNNIDVNTLDVQPVAATITDSVSIELVDPDACPKYLGRVIKGINLNATTPIWLAEKLRRSGIRSIDPVVDITNYVLIELGHPMHAFDLAKIEGGIKVRRATENEELVLLDENKVKLTKDTLVIADHQKPLAIAGVFGGLDSGVKSDTTDILLESAFFNPVVMAGTARSYGLHTDASHRYERGVDYELQHAAMERATALLVEIAGGEVGPIVEAVSEANLPEQTAIVLRRNRLDRVLGHVVSDEEVTTILSRLGLRVEFTGDSWKAISPSFRFDINIEEDLIEEVARVYGYNNIPNISPVATLSMPKRDESKLDRTTFAKSLVNLGYQEAITYSFVDPKVQEKLFPNAETLVLPHPISADMSVMRLSLWSGLLPTVVHNQNRQQSRVRLFETGLRFVPDQASEMNIKQEPMLSGVVTGSVMGESWSEKSRPVDFYDVKADVEALLAKCVSAQEFAFKPLPSDSKLANALHPGQSAEIYRNDKLIGHIGAVHPGIEKSLGLNGKTFVFELELNALINRKLPQAKAVSKFPSNRRDLAIVVKEEVNAGDVLKSIENIGENQLVDLNLFDVYRGDGIDDGYKSLALSLILQDVEKTLDELEINTKIDHVISMLTEQFGATLRD